MWYFMLFLKRGKAELTIKVNVQQFWYTVLYISTYTTQSSYSIPKQTEQLQKKSVTLGRIRYSNICKHCIKFVNIFPNLLTVTMHSTTLLTVDSFPGTELLAAVSNILLFSNNPDSLSKKGKANLTDVFFLNVLKKILKSIKLKMKYSFSWKKKDILNDIKVGRGQTLNY